MNAVDIENKVKSQALAAKAAARQLRSASTTEKNTALLAMANALGHSSDKILAANAADIAAAKAKGISSALIDRLTLNEERLSAAAHGLREVAALPDPVGATVSMTRRPNGLEVGRIRVPLGVVGISYEARPNVTVDAAGLCLKAGNAVILRGGSEAFRSNMAIVEAMNAALERTGLPPASVQAIRDTDRAATLALMRQTGLVDVLIPRGGRGLIRTVLENATVPIIETGEGNCHIFVDESAPLDAASRIVLNAKCQRPGVCNAVETLLIHQGSADRFLPAIAASLAERNVHSRGCERSREIVPELEAAQEADWETEYLDLVLAIKVVDSLAEAIDHIDKYGTGHSEAILTNDYNNAREFLEKVDSAAVYVNASTLYRGHQFGLELRWVSPTRSFMPEANGSGRAYLDEVRHHGSGQTRT